MSANPNPKSNMNFSDHLMSAADPHDHREMVMVINQGSANVSTRQLDLALNHVQR